jgi:SAM-dependent methyltransferase
MREDHEEGPGRAVVASYAGAPAVPAEGVVNYFATPAAAARYATGRPSRPARVLELLRHTLADRLPATRALDVGCGTGHSTCALLPYARGIVGIDASSEMLAQATRDPRIEYRKGYAEALPCRGGEFDLVTVSSAYHWFDHERFLREAARVLRPGGALVLYKAGSMGMPTGQREFEDWRRNVLNARYPKVARNNEPLTAERAIEFGFSELMSETFFHTQDYTLDAYVENLLTHSRIIRAVEGGQEPLGAARAWLREELAAFFSGGAAEFTHEARIHVLQRESHG